jgi:hypothetical protein
VSGRTRGVVVSALALLAAGCGGAVEIDSPTVDARARAACARFLDAVPERVADQRRRETEPDDALGAAWGDPPIVVTCGVDMPDDFDGFSPCEEVNGVGWYIPETAYTQPDSEVTMTTIGFAPVIQIGLPPDYRSDSNGVLVEIGAAVRKTLTQVESCA